MENKGWTRETLAVIESDSVENSPYGPESVHHKKLLERVAGRYLQVTVWRNHVIVHASSDGHPERIREYCNRHGVEWQ